jgi:hypothetical protein
MSWHKRLLSADPGVYREWYWSNPDTGDVALETEWLVDPIAEACRARFNQFDERANWKGEVHHVGVIPRWVIEYEWRVNRRNMLTDKEYVRRWANDSANSGFRTRPGRI